jgi:hypothetical protein
MIDRDTGARVDDPRPTARIRAQCRSVARFIAHIRSPLHGSGGGDGFGGAGGGFAAVAGARILGDRRAGAVALGVALVGGLGAPDAVLAEGAASRRGEVDSSFGVGSASRITAVWAVWPTGGTETARGAGAGRARSRRAPSAAPESARSNAVAALKRRGAGGAGGAGGGAEADASGRPNGYTGKCRMTGIGVRSVAVPDADASPVGCWTVAINARRSMIPEPSLAESGSACRTPAALWASCVSSPGVDCDTGASFGRWPSPSFPEQSRFIITFRAFQDRTERNEAPARRSRRSSHCRYNDDRPAATPGARRISRSPSVSEAPAGLPASRQERNADTRG